MGHPFNLYTQHCGVRFITPWKVHDTYGDDFSGNL